MVASLLTFLEVHHLRAETIRHLWEINFLYPFPKSHEWPRIAHDIKQHVDTAVEKTGAFLKENETDPEVRKLVTSLQYDIEIYTLFSEYLDEIIMSAKRDGEAFDIITIHQKWSEIIVTAQKEFHEHGKFIKMPDMSMMN